MSYILEALKKSEQQRTIGQVPGIDSVHEKAADSIAGNWVWVIVIVLVLNAGLLVLLLWPETETGRPDEPIAEPVPPRQQQAPVLAQEPPPSPVPERRVPPAVPLTPLPEPPPPEPLKAEPLAIPAVGTTVVAVTAPPQPQTAPPPSQAVKADKPPPLPVWPQIPAHLFQQLNGKLRLDVHVYSEQAQDRFVLVNLRKYQEGEKLQEGPQLDAITAEGVILSYRGQRFRVKAN